MNGNWLAVIFDDGQGGQPPLCPHTLSAQITRSPQGDPPPEDPQSEDPPPGDPRPGDLRFGYVVQKARRVREAGVQEAGPKGRNPGADVRKAGAIVFFIAVVDAGVSS